jgi:hypothetical protein
MIRFDSPTLLAVALALVACVVAAASVRRVHLRPLTRALLGSGLVLLALGAGGAAVELRRAGRVAVMVDVSPSTRTATYRSREALDARVGALLGNTPREVREFSPDAGESLPAGFDAVLLFSDGRFDAPDVAPPTYAVVDRALNETRDARVDRIEWRDDTVAVAVANHGPPRDLTVNGSAQAVAGSHVVTRPTREGSGPVVARLNAGDAWPENDALTIYPPPSERRVRWWVGTSAPSGEWVAVAPAALPVDAAEYLHPSLIVLDNVPAEALLAAQQERLLQYARDLGGGVIVIGGDRAFAAGAYAGTPLETVSPLSSTPPRPTTHWVLLADSSGSMAAPAGAAGATRWQRAADALARVMPHVPPEDPVSVGSFARGLRWWSRGNSARETAAVVPPGDVTPHGPTNLQPALESIVAESDGSAPTEILVLSDADAKLDHAALAPPLRAKRIRVHLLATADVNADNPVRRLVESTSGTIVAQADPQRWASALRELLRAAAPPHLANETVTVRFDGPLAGLPARPVNPSNHVWPKERVTPLATATTSEGERFMAAIWNLGAGRAAAAAFAPSSDEIEALAALVASPPRDPRFRVSWDVGRALRVSVDAADGDRMLNDLSFKLELIDASDPSRGREVHAVPQTAPGRYELELPAPRVSRLATVRLDDRIIARRPVAARYAPEFDEIGTDRAALRALADRTGGRVIEATDAGPIGFAWPRRRHDLTAVLATAGAAMVALGLIHWKASSSIAHARRSVT